MPRGTLDLKDLFQVDRWRTLHGDKAQGPPPCTLWPDAGRDVAYGSRGPWQHFPDPARLLGLRWKAHHVEKLFTACDQPLQICKQKVASSRKFINDCRTDYDQHIATVAAVRELLSAGGFFAWMADLPPSTANGVPTRCVGSTRCFFCRERLALEAEQVPTEPVGGGQIASAAGDISSCIESVSSSGKGLMEVVQQRRKVVALRRRRKTSRQRGHSIYKAKDIVAGPTVVRQPETWFAKHTEAPHPGGASERSVSAPGAVTQKLPASAAPLSPYHRAAATLRKDFLEDSGKHSMQSPLEPVDFGMEGSGASVNGGKTTLPANGTILPSTVYQPSVERQKEKEHPSHRSSRSRSEAATFWEDVLEDSGKHSKQIRSEPMDFGMDGSGASVNGRKTISPANGTTMPSTVHQPSSRSATDDWRMSYGGGTAFDLRHGTWVESRKGDRQIGKTHLPGDFWEGSQITYSIIPPPGSPPPSLTATLVRPHAHSFSSAPHSVPSNNLTESSPTRQVAEGFAAPPAERPRDESLPAGLLCQKLPPPPQTVVVPEPAAQTNLVSEPAAHSRSSTKKSGDSSVAASAEVTAEGTLRLKHWQHFLQKIRRRNKRTIATEFRVFHGWIEATRRREIAEVVHQPSAVKLENSTSPPASQEDPLAPGHQLAPQVDLGANASVAEGMSLLDSLEEGLLAELSCEPKSEAVASKCVPDEAPKSPIVQEAAANVEPLDSDLALPRSSRTSHASSWRMQDGIWIKTNPTIDGTQPETLGAENASSDICSSPQHALQFEQETPPVSQELEATSIVTGQQQANKPIVAQSDASSGGGTASRTARTSVARKNSAAASRNSISDSDDSGDSSSATPTSTVVTSVTASKHSKQSVSKRRSTRTSMDSDGSSSAAASKSVRKAVVVPELVGMTRPESNARPSVGTPAMATAEHSDSSSSSSPTSTTTRTSTRTSLTSAAPQSARTLASSQSDPRHQTKVPRTSVRTSQLKESVEEESDGSSSDGHSSATGRSAPVKKRQTEQVETKTSRADAAPSDVVAPEQLPPVPETSVVGQAVSQEEILTVEEVDEDDVVGSGVPSQPQRSAEADNAHVEQDVTKQMEADLRKVAGPELSPSMQSSLERGASGQQPQKIDVQVSAKAAPSPSTVQAEYAAAERKKLVGLSPLFRAKDLAKVFADADADKDGVLGSQDLISFLGAYLGYGHAEITAFQAEYGEESGVTSDGFKKGLKKLNPYFITQFSERLIVRKPGAFGGHDGIDLALDGCKDCTILICDRTAQLTADELTNCHVMLGPCETSIFLRNCENCTFWLATKQLRTRDCKNCVFYLHSNTEPVIETSEDLKFAPFAAEYPGLTKQFSDAKLDVSRNFWSAIFDFSGKAHMAHWSFLPLDDCEVLNVSLSGFNDPPDNPAPALTQELLLKKPPASAESIGQSVANIPQTKPPPPPPSTRGRPWQRCISDMDDAFREGNVSDRVR